MMTWIWVLIPLVAIVTSFILKFQRNQYTMADKSREMNKEVQDLENQLQAMQRRIENLEAIAAAEPENFREEKIKQNGPLGFDDTPEQANRKTVEKMAKNRTTINMTPDSLITYCPEYLPERPRQFLYSAKIAGLIRHWIDSKGKTSSDDLVAVVKEFKAYQQTVERRLQNLEAIAAEDKQGKPLLDLEEDDHIKKDDGFQSDSRLQNMLKKSS